MFRNKIQGIVFLSILFLSFIPQTLFASLVGQNPIDDVGISHNDNSLSNQTHKKTNSKRDQSAGNLKPPTPSPEVLEDEGILNPREVIQSATFSTTWYNLRTDVIPNPVENLFIDRAHDWMGHKVDISIQNLNNLYVKNGTFEYGINGTNVDGLGNAHPFGWSEYIYDAFGGDEQTLRTSYINTSRYSIVENEGRDDGDEYKHKKETLILWNQTVTLDPFTGNFFLRFDYRYDSGPLGTKYDDKVYINVYFVDGPTFEWDKGKVYGIDAALLGDHGHWFDTGLLGINTTMPTTFNFAIGLCFENDANLKKNDFVGQEHNARYIRVSLDNVTLVALQKPYPSEVELKAQLPNCGWTDITNSSRGMGTASVSYEYWDNDPLPIIFNSSRAVSFDCSVILHTLNNKSSTWEMNYESIGVRYEVTSGQSVNLSLWTVVSYPASYQNFKFNLTFPTDWENITVYDSFPSNVTDQCTIEPGFIEISGLPAEQVGWWHVIFKAPNYANTASTQIRNAVSWQNESTFRCTNITRVVGRISTSGNIPNPLVGINSTWLLSNQTLWSQTLSNGDIDGNFNSSQRTFGSLNTTAGLWIVLVSWNNGSEVAFIAIEFSLHHRTRLTPKYSIIETEPGSIVIGMVEFIDEENNAYLLNPAAELKANWSSTIVFFNPNPVHNRWEAEFNTQLVGLGDYSIRVNATQIYFDNASCVFIIRIIYDTQLTSPNAPWDSAGWGTIKNISLHFERFNISTQNWDDITNDTNYVRIWCNWTIGGWTVAPLSGLPGFYQLEINTSMLPASTWVLNITTQKFGHTPRKMTITLFIDIRITTLTTFGELSPVIQMDETYDLKLRFEDADEIGIQNATLNIYEISPSSGLSYSPILDWPLEVGNYSVTFTPLQPAVYVIRIEASKFGFQNATTVFILAVTEVYTVLEIVELSSSETNLGIPIDVKVWYHSNKTGIESANINIAYTNPDVGLGWDAGTSVPGEPGNYTITITPYEAEYYLVVINATKQYHRVSTVSFYLRVEALLAQLDVIGQTTLVLSIGENALVTLRYHNGTHGLPGAQLRLFSVLPENGLSNSSFTDMGNGNYTITLTPSIVESFSIVFEAELTNYVTRIAYMTLISTEIETAGLTSELPAEIYVGQTVSLEIQYLVNSTKEGISNANVTIEGLNSDYWNFEDYHNGSYTVRLNPDTIGEYPIRITFTKLDHKPWVLDYYYLQPLSVQAVPIDIHWATEGYIPAIEGIPFTFKVTLFENTPTGTPIVGAVVEYFILGQTGEMTDLENGTYSKTIVLPLGTFTLQVKAIKTPNYEISEAYITVVINSNAPLRQAQVVGIFLIVILVLTIGYVTRRKLRKRQMAIQLKMLDARQDFEDARNIVSILILDKNSGIPFLSSQIREDMPSELVAGFVSAISTFRRELISDDKRDDLLQVTPISDIIHTCSTKYTLCVLITLMPPSLQLQEKLVEFTKIIAQEYDHMLQQRLDKPIERIIPRTVQEAITISFNLRLLLPSFNNFDTSVPRKFRKLAKMCNTLYPNSHVNLVEVARQLTEQGMREEQAYYLIKKAISAGYLVPLPKTQFTPNNNTTESE